MEYWPAFTQKFNQIMVNIPARSIWDVFSEPKPTRRQETGRWPHVRFRLDLHLGTLMCIAVKDSKGGNNSTIPSGNLTIAIEHGHLVRCFIYISGWYFGTWFFYCFHILENSWSQLTNSIFFRGVGQPATSYEKWWFFIVVCMFTRGIQPYPTCQEIEQAHARQQKALFV